MSARSARRIERLEDAATARMVHEIARRYALTEDEKVEVMRETQRELRRWRAGLPLAVISGREDDEERTGDHPTL